jgi:hypothetical protein
MTTTEAASRRLFDELQPGDQVELLHGVKVGRQQWTTRVVGKVLRKERRRHGLHFRRNLDDKVFSDVIVLEVEGGALTTVTMDEYTQLRRV